MINTSVLCGDTPPHTQDAETLNHPTNGSSRIWLTFNIETKAFYLLGKYLQKELVGKRRKNYDWTIKLQRSHTMVKLWWSSHQIKPHPIVQNNIRISTWELIQSHGWRRLECCGSMPKKLVVSLIKTSATAICEQNQMKKLLWRPINKDNSFTAECWWLGIFLSHI